MRCFIRKNRSKMRGVFVIIICIMVFYLGSIIMFNFSNRDKITCESMCMAQGKVYRGIEWGLVMKKCYCVTDWLKKQREEEEIRKELRKRKRSANPGL